MDTLLQHLHNRAEVSAAISWHGQDDQIGVLEAIRSSTRETFATGLMTVLLLALAPRTQWWCAASGDS